MAERNAVNPALEALVEESRARQHQSLRASDRSVTWLLAFGFLAAAAPLALLAPTERHASGVTIALLLATYAAVSRIQFEVGSGAAVPTQLVLVPMLFLLPAGAVPLAVALGFTLGMSADLFLGRLHPERVAVALGNSWHAVGPALVFLAAGEPGLAGHDWPVYLAALGAQFAFDLASSTARERLGLAVPVHVILRSLAWVFMVDALLAPIGVLAALAAAIAPETLLLVLPLGALLAVFGRERTGRLDQAIELSNAYRGTALLLGDVVEADDAYTGSHSRQVVELVLAVADELGLAPADRRKAELAALLHDVGKIRIPAEIILKPGPLTAHERTIMNTHTLEGEALLKRVGGLLGEVGEIVRSCHERVDGGGYPDGLVGDAIPPIARIVCCCDAFNAMTTDRPYRAAMPVPQALAELRREAGAQFDAAVVAALARVVEREQPARLLAIAS